MHWFADCGDQDSCSKFASHSLCDENKLTNFLHLCNINSVLAFPVRLYVCYKSVFYRIGQITQCCTAAFGLGSSFMPKILMKFECGYLAWAPNGAIKWWRYGTRTAMPRCSSIIFTLSLVFFSFFMLLENISVQETQLPQTDRATHYVSWNVVHHRNKLLLLYNRSTTNRSNGVRGLQLIDL